MLFGKYLSLIEASEITGYDAGHLRRLLRAGTVEGTKFGRDWFVTVEALDAYIATNPRPGPPKKSTKEST